jgi:hypothetical protein
MARAFMTFFLAPSLPSQNGISCPYAGSPQDPLRTSRVVEEDDATSKAPCVKHRRPAWRKLV